MEHVWSIVVVVNSWHFVVWFGDGARDFVNYTNNDDD